METISCHSNQSSYSTGIKKHNFQRGQFPTQVCLLSASSALRFLRRRILNIFSKIYPLCQPIKLSDLDKSRMKHGGLLNKHIRDDKNSNISSKTAETVNCHISHYKSMGAISFHSNQNSYLTRINQRTIGPVNTHLISWPNKAQNIQNLENIW